MSSETNICYASHDKSQAESAKMTITAIPHACVAYVYRYTLRTQHMRSTLTRGEPRRAAELSRPTEIARIESTE